MHMHRAACLSIMLLLAAPALAQEAAAPSPAAPAVAPAAASSPVQSDGKTYQAVALRALNKVTARTELLEVGLGDTVPFGNIMVTPRTCFVSASDKLPEQAVFLEIGERRDDGTQKRIFTGWMFASSPALSALQHPVYDITMVACKESLTPTETKAEPAKP